MHIDVIGIRSPINRRGDSGLTLKVEFAQIKLDQGRSVVNESREMLGVTSQLG